jgi:DNA-binding protein YbaB
VPEDISATERMVAEWQQRAAERASKFDAMREQVEQISVTESTGDGAVRVTIGSNGILQDIQIGDSAGKRPMSQLSSEIMRTVQKAQSRIPELMQQAVADTVGTEDTAAQHMLDEARRNFPEAPEEDEPRSSPGVQEMDLGIEDDEAPPPRQATPPPRPAPRADEDDEDDDWSDGSFLR